MHELYNNNNNNKLDTTEIDSMLNRIQSEDVQDSDCDIKWGRGLSPKQSWTATTVRHRRMGLR